MKKFLYLSLNLFILFFNFQTYSSEKNIELKKMLKFPSRSALSEKEAGVNAMLEKFSFIDIEDLSDEEYNQYIFQLTVMINSLFEYADLQNRLIDFRTNFIQSFNSVKQERLEADPQRYAYRGLNIFLGDQDPGPGFDIEAIEKMVWDTLSQNSGPTIVSTYILQHLLKLLLKNGDQDFIDSQNQLWVVKKITNNLVMLLPNFYFEELGVVSDDVELNDYSKDGVSKLELLTGLKISHFETISLDQILDMKIDMISSEYKKLFLKQSELFAQFKKLNPLFKGFYFGPKIVDEMVLLEKKIDSFKENHIHYFITELLDNNIFCTNQDYQMYGLEQIQKPIWSIYISGHGLPEKTIVDMGIEDFKTMLDYLAKKINTRLLVYTSCYDSGTNAELVYEGSFLHEKTYPFTIISSSAVDSSTTKLAIFKVNGYLQFIQWVKNINIDYKDALDVLLKDEVENLLVIPQIKLAGTEWFYPIKSNKNNIAAGSIGKVLAENRIESLNIRIFFNNPHVLYLYTKNIPFELVIDSEKLSAIISMISGEVIHSFEKIKAEGKTLDEIEAMFSGVVKVKILDEEAIFSAINTKNKIFYIKELKVANNEKYNNLFIYNYSGITKKQEFVLVMYKNENDEVISNKNFSGSEQDLERFYNAFMQAKENDSFPDEAVINELVEKIKD